MIEKISELIKTFLPLPIALPLILHIAILAGIWLLPHLEELLPPNLYPAHGKVPVLTISISVLSLYLLMLASYIILYIKFKNKLTPKFGVFWDKNKEPYCPACQSLLNKESVNISDPDATVYLKCIHCDKYVYLSLDEPKRLTLSEAKKYLK